MFIPFYSGVNFYLPWPCSEYVIRTESARIFYSVHMTEVAQKVKKQRTVIIDRPRNRAWQSAKFARTSFEMESCT